ncbi:MAG TPA: cytosine methyltransferase [Flavobacteriaceae bacterium]|jgi:very-short-patch-repair endonuclease|nr:cytosine methyltransferase [Flavobacteriaceae bacterium]MAM27773.1 cytosine methyltransferase [Flavobacteriaceae bacterium]MAY52290.1 cytosine methyltransferase [Flavobacteriaceae bacterium]HBR54446.1 cytosine methyltransferase [Flavobacteriaceae bacterium]|tara:strand:+ start:12 stop:380 length:369 start_codon:yes stop_codon:yes gene_type:complete
MNEKLHNWKHLKQRRKELRNNATLSEKRLWNFIKNSQLEGRKFRRQHSIANYIVDFYCPSEKLIIELDGGVHNNTVNQNHDFERQGFLVDKGFTVIRFQNSAIKDSIEQVLTEISNNFATTT